MPKRLIWWREFTETAIEMGLHEIPMDYDNPLDIKGSWMTPEHSRTNHQPSLIKWYIPICFMFQSPIPMMAQSPFLWPLPPYSWCPWCPMPGSRHVIGMPRHDVRIGWDVDVGSREGITWAGERGCCAMVRWVNVGVIPASLGTTRWLPNEWLQEIWPLKIGGKWRQSLSMGKSNRFWP